MNIFRQAEVADIRLFAGFTLGTFLIALAISALALAPHLTAPTLAIPLVIAGVTGLAGVAAVARLWTRLNGARRGQLAVGGEGNPLCRGMLQVRLMALAFLGLLVVAVLLPTNPSAALAILASPDGGLIVHGTQSSWLLLSHAGGESAAGSAGG